MGMKVEGSSMPGRAGRVLGYRTSQDSDIVVRVRTALKLTQEDFARELGCSTSTVAKMEREKRTPGTRALKDNLARLAIRAGVMATPESK
ncbi:MAG: XRE family transcriptional regulator [Proteobacteria bacterium]|nr:MAG: XRE family transcriptional regulator [Pseudomonadota bacterium]